jgi:nucleotide-binding universal stress UspA family protein
MRNLFRRILVPYDFSDHAAGALGLASDLAARNGGRLSVLHVITPFYPTADLPMPQPMPTDELVAGIRRRLDAVVGRLVRRRKAVRARCEVVIGDPFQRIVDAARGADSIVMATAGRTGLSHLFMGSVAEKVVRHAPVPVLTVRPASLGKRRGRGKRAARRR